MQKVKPDQLWKFLDCYRDTGSGLPLGSAFLFEFFPGHIDPVLQMDQSYNQALRHIVSVYVDWGNFCS